MSPSPLTCPRCRAPLEPHHRGTALAAGCRRCGGIWLGAAASETVAAALDPRSRETASAVEGQALRRPVDAGEVARCAECGALMRRFLVGGVEVDHCDQHGTWYDLGELEQVAGRLDARARGEDVAIEDQGVPGPRPVEPGKNWRQGTGQAAAVATPHDTGEDLELDVRGRRLEGLDGAGPVGGQVAQVFVPDDAPWVAGDAYASGGRMAGSGLDRTGLERAKRIADLCRGADRSLEPRPGSRFGTRRSLFDVLGVVGDALDWD